LPQNADESVLANMERIPPSKISTGQIYRVRKGDTLSQIARRFRMTVEKLKRVNGLKSNIIAPGRKLIIPRGTL
jgi:LysM repeat protein